VSASDAPSPVTRADSFDEEPSEAGDEGCIVVRHGRARRLLDVRDHPEVVIGRSRGATIVIDDDRVSRRHLRIIWRERALYAEDLGSKNGSTLNGRPLNGRTARQTGDELVAGPVEVLVCGRLGGVDVLLSEAELSARLATEVERAARFKRQLGVVGLTLQGSPGACRQAALRAASRLRRIDLAGEYAAGEYLLLLPESGRPQAEAVAATVSAVAREVAGVQAAARAAALPDDGTAPDELIAATLGQIEGPSPAAVGAAVVVAEDEVTRTLFEMARRVARSEVTVLLTGETGVGKEVVAAEIHRASSRAAGPYVRINCASIPETLIESELFGHEQGAFTGADRRRIGILERAHGGTLLFDEIGELPAAMQAKLLRVLEERKVLRVGGTEELDVDVRFVAATNRDLEEEAARGAFRQDLFFRLSAITLRVPPLRERPRDLPLLAALFADRSAQAAARAPVRLSEPFQAALARYPWPGNVRELRNVVERAVVLAGGSDLTASELPERLALLAPARGGARLPDPTVGSMPDRLEDLERRTLGEALQTAGGNRTHAARALGISRRALLYKLKKYGLS
jgi:DNA-binding NtrC family response regulator/pSer/pThr/pTyr-binding forkhead associated (FHA) protein